MGRRWCCCFSFWGLLGRRFEQQQHFFSHKKNRARRNKNQFLRACVKKGKVLLGGEEEIAGRYERERIQGVLVCVWIDRGSAFFWRVLALFVGWLLCFQRQQQQQKSARSARLKMEEEGGRGSCQRLAFGTAWVCPLKNIWDEK